MSGDVEDADGGVLAAGGDQGGALPVAAEDGGGVLAALHLEFAAVLQHDAAVVGAGGREATRVVRAPRDAVDGAADAVVREALRHPGREHVHQQHAVLGRGGGQQLERRRRPRHAVHDRLAARRAARESRLAVAARPQLDAAVERARRQQRLAAIARPERAREHSLYVTLQINSLLLFLVTIFIWVKWVLFIRLASLL